jgi:hypothetical protein
MVDLAIQTIAYEQLQIRKNRLILTCDVTSLNLYCV